MQDITKTIYCDAAVVGGGVGGCAAAIEAARRGLHTVVFEKGVSLGGLATNGYVPSVAGCVEGISLEFCKRLEEIGQLRNGVKLSLKLETRENYYHCPSFEPEYGKIVLEDMLMEAGARVIYDATFIDTEVEDGSITAAIFYTKGGLMRVIARIYIDATGDADVAAASGVPYEVGGQDFGGLNMSTTLGSRWAGADLLRYEAAENEWKESQKKAGVKNPLPLIYVLEEAVARGELTHHICNKGLGFYRVILPNTPLDNADFCTFAFHSYYCHNTDVTDISRQILEQHQLMKQFHRFLKNNVPGFENLRLVGTGSIPGVRDSLRVFGEYMLKASDLVCGVKFDDGIARFPEMLDTHHPTSQEWFFCRHIHIPEPSGSAVCETEHIGRDCDARMHPFGVPGGIPARPNPRDWCDIPYRTLVPMSIDNLLSVGRCCSAEFHANGSMRIIAPAMGTGQAAGVAAFISITRKKRPRDIDGREVRRLMIEEGVRLDDAPDGPWEDMRNRDGELVINAGDAITIVPK